MSPTCKSMHISPSHKLLGSPGTMCTPGRVVRKIQKHINKYKNTAVKFEFQINNRYNLNMFQILHCCCSVIKSCPTICNPMNCTMPGFPVHHYLPEFAQFMSIESVMPSNHLILCRPLLLLPLIFPSIRAFSNELALHIRWPKY